MFTYFRDGGFGMWLILLVALGSFAFAVASKKHRQQALWLGSYGSIVTGVLGMAAGMVAVSKNVFRFADVDKAKAVAEGLGELSNNGSFGAVMAIGLGIAAILCSPVKERASA